MDPLLLGAGVVGGLWLLSRFSQQTSSAPRSRIVTRYLPGAGASTDRERIVYRDRTSAPLPAPSIDPFLGLKTAAAGLLMPLAPQAARELVGETSKVVTPLLPETLGKATHAGLAFVGEGAGAAPPVLGIYASKLLGLRKASTEQQKMIFGTATFQTGETALGTIPLVGPLLGAVSASLRQTYEGQRLVKAVGTSEYQVYKYQKDPKGLAVVGGSAGAGALYGSAGGPIGTVGGALVGAIAGATVGGAFEGGRSHKERVGRYLAFARTQQAKSLGQLSSVGTTSGGYKPPTTAQTLDERLKNLASQGVRITPAVVSAQRAQSEARTTGPAPLTDEQIRTQEDARRRDQENYARATAAKASSFGYTGSGGSQPWISGGWA